jgi:four helix bundle protein
MQDYSNLRVWQAAFDLQWEIYQLTRSFPAAERFGLTAQMRGAARSIGANIAEGCGRSTRRELRWFLSVAMGSACELECDLRFAARLGLQEERTLRGLLGRLVEVKRMLGCLIRKLREAANQ